MDSLWRLLLAPLLVLMLAALAYWLQRRWRAARAPGAETSAQRVQLVDSLALGQNSRLLVVEWMGRRLLLAQSDGKIKLVDQQPAAIDRPSPP
jgi:flagellar biogenesis protein FliO